jgi:hypothetical protein
MSQKIIVTLFVMLVSVGAFFISFAFMFVSNSIGGNGGGGGGFIGNIAVIIYFIVLVLSIVIWFNGVMFVFTRNENYYKYVVDPMKILRSDKEKKENQK